MTIMYLLGAGASYNSIPTIKSNANFHSMVDYIYETLTSFKFKTGVFAHIEENNCKELFDFVQTTAIETAQKFQEYGTPDTYARSLYLKGESHSKEYDNIKVTLSLFFILWRFYKKESSVKESLDTDILPQLYGFDTNDNRYISFLASILKRGKGSPDFPESIKILSWNYDSELEDVLNNFFFKKPYNIKSLKSKYSILNFNDLEEFYDKNIIKLNGTYYDVNEPLDDIYSSLIDFDSEDISQNLNSSLKRFNDLMIKGIHRSSIQFSWDNTNLSFSNIPHEDKLTINYKSLNRILSDADILIIIGYSFPIFNREMDSFMIKSFLEEDPDRKVIHIQNTQHSMDGIKQRIRALSNYTGKINFQEHLGLDEFYIPFEFN